MDQRCVGPLGAPEGSQEPQSGVFIEIKKFRHLNTEVTGSRATFNCAAAVFLLSLATARAEIVVTVDKSAQRLAVEVDGSPATDGQCRPRAGVTARRMAATGRNGWRANGSRANTIGHRCPIRYFLMRATLSMAATRSRISAGLPRMVASASILKTLLHYSRWSRVICKTPGSSLPARDRHRGYVRVSKTSQEIPSRRRRNFEDIFSNRPDTDRGRPTWQDMH